MLIAIRDVPVDEPQGYLGIINPYDFTIIVAIASSIQTHLATTCQIIQRQTSDVVSRCLVMVASRIGDCIHG